MSDDDYENNDNGVNDGDDVSNDSDMSDDDATMKMAMTSDCSSLLVGLVQMCKSKQI